MDFSDNQIKKRRTKAISGGECAVCLSTFYPTNM